MTASEIFRLSNEERQSAVWHRLQAHLQFERQSRLEQLSGDMPEAKTQMLRGEIAAFTAVLELGADRPRINVGGDTPALVAGL